MTRALIASLVLVLVGGCVPSTGREIVEIPLVASGTAVTSFAVDDFVVTLERAEVAIGPLYVCPTGIADFALCDPALVERLEPFVIDALDPTEADVGTLVGTTGAARTAFFDYGISWPLTSSEPVVSPVAPERHSAVLEGTATRGDDVVRFVAAIDVAPIARGGISVQGVPADGTIAGRERLVVRVDPSAFLAAVDFEDLLVEVTDPAVPVTLERASQAYQAIVLQMTAGAPPTFEWQGP